MREKPKCFIINKKSDWLRGFGGIPADDKLTADGVFFSEPFDGGERGTRWYKLASLFKIPVNCSLKVTFFVTDSAEISVNGSVYGLGELIRSSGSPENKLRLFSENCENVSHMMTDEILLTELRGRYLFFAVRGVSSGREFPEIYEARLFFSPYMLTGFLPEIFGDDPFLERYLAVFQSLYEDMEEKIDHAPESYTAENPDRGFLKWLSDIFQIRTADLWNEEQLRYIIKNAPRLYRYIGTKAVIEELCGLYLGCRAEVVEYYDKAERGYSDNYGIPEDKLFPDPYVFTVIVHAARLSPAVSDGLERIIDACRPAHMSANIITLGGADYKEIRLGSDTLLDDGIILS